MAYNRFTLQEVEQRFGLQVERDEQMFPTPPQAIPSAFLETTLARNLSLALDMNTEKARSELLIAPVLVEIIEQRQREISLHSGIDFTVDRSLGLAGFCDFLLSRSPQRTELVAPVLTVVEAKKEDIPGGFGQCLAEMVAAQRFNQLHDTSIVTIYGVVTTGDRWRFMQLQGTQATIDPTEIYLASLPTLLGILLRTVA